MPSAGGAARGRRAQLEADPGAIMFKSATAQALVAIFDKREGHAAYFLQEQDLSSPLFLNMTR